MAFTKNRSFARRDFLRGAAGLVGASVVGLPGLAEAQTTIGGIISAQPVSVAYWDGVAWVLATSLPKGDASLQTVAIGLHGYGSGTSIRSIDAYPGKIPFSAWSAAPQGCPATQYGAPVGPGGVLLSVNIQSGPKTVPIPILFTPGSGTGPKLREGVYALALGKVDWIAYGYAPSTDHSPLVDASGNPATFQHVIMTVTRTG